MAKVFIQCASSFSYGTLYARLLHIIFAIKSFFLYLLEFILYHWKPRLARFCIAANDLCMESYFCKHTYRYLAAYNYKPTFGSLYLHPLFASLYLHPLFASLYLQDFICQPLFARLYLQVFICQPLFASLYLPAFICKTLFARLYLQAFICQPLFASIYLPAFICQP